MLWPWTIRSPPRVRRSRRAASGPALPAYSWRWPSRTSTSNHATGSSSASVARTASLIASTEPPHWRYAVVSECISRWSPSRPTAGSPASQANSSSSIPAWSVSSPPLRAQIDSKVRTTPRCTTAGVAEAPHPERDHLVVAEHREHRAAGLGGLVDEAAYERDDAEPVGPAVEEVAEHPQPGVTARPARRLVERARRPAAQRSARRGGRGGRWSRRSQARLAPYDGRARRGYG